MQCCQQGVVPMSFHEILYAPGVRAEGELSLRHCGWEGCTPGHSYGPAVRDHFLIHYIHEGCGTFRSGGTESHLSKGDGFLIRPSEVTYYVADQEDPWTYCWVGFDGTRAVSLLALAGLADSSVFHCDRDDVLWKCVQDVREVGRGAAYEEIATVGYLYQFLSHLIEEHGASSPSPRAMSEVYAQRAVRYIEDTFGMPITIGGIAAHLGIDRTHLFRVFHRHFGVSPQEYLLDFRIRKACELLRRTSLSIGEIACSVGFDEAAHFSATFRGRRGMSPREFRTKGDAG
jgi:AraC-like DNA-binding protein